MKIASLPVLAALAALGFATSLPAKEPSAVAWTQDYALDRMPSDATPRWIKHVYGTGKCTVEGETLTLSTTDDGMAYWRYNGGDGDPDWDPGRPTTVEFRAEIEGAASADSNGAMITLGDGRNLYFFLLKSAPMKTYRVLLENGVATLYAEGESEPVASTRGGALHDEENPRFLYFGDGSGKVEGVSRWKFIRWTNEGAFPFDH